jgi:hypothetical protein
MTVSRLYFYSSETCLEWVDSAVERPLLATWLYRQFWPTSDLCQWQLSTRSCRSHFPELPFNSQNAFAHGVIVDTPCQLTSESCLMAS